MKRWIRILLPAALLALGNAPPAGALSLSLLPGTQNALPGGAVAVSLVASGLGGVEPVAIGAFDLDVGWDAALLTLSSVAFSDALGDPAAVLPSEVLTSVVSISGLADLAALSLLAPEDLLARQGDAITLAVLHFVALAPGTASLVIAPDAASEVFDAFAAPLAIAAQTGATIQVVPESGTGLLLGSGLLGVAWRRRRARARRHAGA